MLKRWFVAGAILGILGALPSVAGAATVHQTKTFWDGSQVVVTVSDEGDGIPQSGSGKDVGDLSPAAPPEAQTALLYPKGTPLPEHPDSGSGITTMGGQAKFTNYLGVTLFTYVEVVTWNWANYKVTSIYNQRGFAASTCCTWQFKGNSQLNASPPGAASFTAFAQGKFEACALIVTGCSGKAPWINLTGNGNGLQTGFSWGGL